MANTVMRMPLSGRLPQIVGAGIQDGENKSKVKPIMMKRGGSESGEVTEIDSTLSKTKGKGQPLDLSMSGFMGNAFSADFKNVRVHKGQAAVEMNRSINARAFTHGRDIYFNRGEYSPKTNQGKSLLGHVLLDTGGHNRTDTKNAMYTYATAARTKLLPA